MAAPQAYTKLSIFKRIEVWILLVLAVAGLVYVLLSRQEHHAERAPQAPPPARQPARPAPTNTAPESAYDPGGALEVKSVRVKRNGGEYLTEIDFDYDNQTEETLRTIDAARLITASGKSLPAFFLAFTGAPAELPAKQRSAATVRFGLSSEDIIGELELDVGGQRKAIKSARSFDPEAIASRESKTFNSLDW